MRDLARLLLLSLCSLAIIHAAPDRSACAQDRSPTFPFGPSIPDSSGQNTISWLSGDGPYGVYIQPNYSLWCFSDTYFGPYGSTARSLSRFYGNSIAIGQTSSSINAGNFTPYYFNKGTAQSPGAFFPNQAPGYRYYPRRPIMINGKLYVFLHTIYTPPGGGADQYLGNFVARVTNPTAIPTAWNIETFGLFTTAPGTNCPLVFGLEAQLFATDPNNLYVYCVWNPGNITAIPLVITLDIGKLETTAAGQFFPQAYAQYLASYANQSPSFGPGFGVPASGQQPAYFNTGINPYYYSLRWNGTAQRWQVVGNIGLAAGPSAGANANNNQSGYIWMNPNPFGPFNGAGTTAAQLPNYAEFTSGYDPYVQQSNKYVYTTREWVDTQLTNDYQIAITYTYSSTSLADTVNDNLTYTTRFASFPNPLLPLPSSNGGAAPRAMALGGTAFLPPVAPADQVLPDPVAWEDTPAAALMPKPRPTPVSGFTPIEQRLPWEIETDAATGVAPPRVKASGSRKLKVKDR